MGLTGASAIKHAKVGYCLHHQGSKFSKILVWTEPHSNVLNMTKFISIFIYAEL